MMLWGVCVRVVIGLHATWLVNSAAHMWGKRRFATSDDSRNNWWVALLTFGEGWHNNHHAHPTSARHGLRWYELDLTWLQIRFLQFLGLVKAVKVPNLALSPKPREVVQSET
jgi:stearoyl-CoA desaturase (delta-9 desaturase)